MGKAIVVAGNIHGHKGQVRLSDSETRGGVFAGTTSLAVLPAIEVAKAARAGEVVGKQAVRVTLGTDLL
jgi:hypothetical protein